MAAMLRDSVVVAVVRRLPRAIPLVVIAMRKSTCGVPFLSHMNMGHRLCNYFKTYSPSTGLKAYMYFFFEVLVLRTSSCIFILNKQQTVLAACENYFPSC